MKKFSDNLSTLESVDQISRLELRTSEGQLIATIENKPGSQGSLKLYHHLWKKFGAISPQAAKEGLELYAEHTADAHSNPGKHPNIDRLFGLISEGKTLKASALP